MYYQRQAGSLPDLETESSVPIFSLKSILHQGIPNSLVRLSTPQETQTVNENVLDVLIYIYENYMDSEESVPADQILLEEELLQAGFPKGEVKKAFDWLDELAWRQGTMDYANAEPNRAIRVYNDREQQKIDLEIQGMLLQLEQTGILDPMSREIVIERALAIESEELSADDVKWIVLLVLLNQPGQENAFALMEELVYNGEPVYLH